MPSLPNSNSGPMSSVTWGEAASRVAGAVSGTRLPDSVSAAKDALQETLEDWDSRRDWKYTQVVAPDITLTAGDSEFDLPSLFKKPYVAYLQTSRKPLFYIERANWHRVFPGTTDASAGRYYTLFNEMASGQGQLFPPVDASDTLVLLYYRPIIVRDDDNALLDIPQRWTGYILRGARALLTTGKSAGKKSDDWWALYEKGIKQAKSDDLRVPDQFVSFMPPESMYQPYWFNPNSTWASVIGE